MRQKGRQGVVSFYKAFDPGWKAYEISSKESKLAEFFPFIFGKEIKNHVVVNNWANGWIIDPEREDLNTKHHVVIVFLPQYLEYTGIVSLALLFIFALGISIKQAIQKIRS
jgi:hypothetical protein